MTDGPFAGALLAGLVENDVDEGFAGLGIGPLEDVGGDLDEEGIQFAFVPVGKDFREFGGARIDGRFENGVGLADELHVAVFDAVVDHLDVVAGAIRAHVPAAGFALGDRGDLGVNGRNCLPAFGRTAGHDAGPLESAFLAAADADAEEMDALLAQGFFPALGVGPERIATVDDDVARLEQGHELRNDGVNRAAGLDHDLHLARLGEGSDKFLQSLAAGKVFPLSTAGNELLHHVRGAIEDRHLKASAFHVEDKVFAHDGEPDEANITLLRAHFAYLLFSALGWSICI